MQLPESQQAHVHWALMIIAFGVVLVGLIYGAGFLIPIVVAFLVVNVLEAIIERLRSVYVPTVVAVPLAVLVVLTILAAVVFVVVSQIDEFIAAWPRYIARLQVLGGQVAAGLGEENAVRLQKYIGEVDIAGRLSTALGTAGSLLLNFGLVVLYVGFLLAERGRIVASLASLGSSAEKSAQISTTLGKISKGMHQYLLIKTVLSLATGLLSYGVLRALGVDFAETWAVVIFLLNYIPSIGSVLGVVFPALLALIQFDTLGPFLVIVGVLTVVQFGLGNILEPMLMGRSLDLSAFTVMVSLTFWSTVWGIAGAFLAVPLMAAVVIVCREIEGWRWVATLLSNDQPAS